MNKRTEEWLNAGGAEIIFEVVRRYGWKITLEKEWELKDSIVSVSDRDTKQISLNGSKNAYDKVFAVLSAAEGIASYGRHSQGRYPIFESGDDAKMWSLHFDRILELCDYSRCISEETLAVMSRLVGGKEENYGIIADAGSHCGHDQHCAV